MLKIVLVFNPEKMQERLHLRFFKSYYVMLRHHVFLWFHAGNLIYVTLPQKQVADQSARTSANSMKSTSAVYKGSSLFNNIDNMR